MLKKLCSFLLILFCANTTIVSKLQGSLEGSLQGSLAGSLQGSLQDSLDGNVCHYSLLLFVLEKNVVRIECYALDELAQEVNKLTRHDTDTRCVYMLRLSERGQAVTDIQWPADNMKKLLVGTHRNKKRITYELDWVSLVAQEHESGQNYMRADVIVRDVFTVGGKNMSVRDSQDQMTPRGIHWLTSLAVTWGLAGHQLVINFILDRKIQGIASAIVSNRFLRTDLSMRKEFYKHELLATGDLIAVPNDNRSCALDLYEDDYALQEQDDVESMSNGTSWLFSAYSLAVTTLSNIKNFLCASLSIG